MITPPPGWERHAGANVLTLLRPGGAGRIRFFDRLRVQPFSQVVREVLAHDPGFRPTRAGAVARLATLEGEFAAWVELGGEREDAAVERAVGAVLTDDFVAAIDAVSLRDDARPSLFAVARALLDHSSFGLGQRRRRFVYRPPTGWQGLPGGLVTTWYPLDFPRNAATVVVYPAEPARGDDPTSIFDELLADEEARGFVRAGELTAETCVAQDGLAGRIMGYRGRWPGDDTPLVREVAILSDGRYRHVLRLEARADARLDDARAALRRTAESATPLPQIAGGATAFGVASVAALSGPWKD